MKHWHRNRRKFTLLLILIPILLLLLLIGVIYIPAVQRWSVRRALSALEQSTGWQITVGEARLSFPLRLDMKQILALESSGDTVLWVERLNTHIPILPLFNGRLEVPRIKLTDGRVDMALDSLQRSRLEASFGSLEAGYVQVNLHTLDIDVAAAALHGGFLAYTQWEQGDSSTAGANMNIALHRLDLDQFETRIHLYPTQVHTEAKVLKGVVDKGLLHLPDFSLSLERVQMQLKELSYMMDTLQTKTPWIDYSHMHYYDAELDLSDFFVNKAGKVYVDVHQAKIIERSGASIRSMHGNFSLAEEVISLRNIDLQTPYSQVQGTVVLPLKALKGDRTATGLAQIKGHISPRDLYLFTQISLDSLLYRPSGHPELAELPIHLDVDLSGALEQLEIQRLLASIPSLVDIAATGQGKQLLAESQRTASLSGTLRLGARAKDLLGLFAPSSQLLTLPNQTDLQFQTQLKSDNIQTNLTLTTPHGSLGIDASYKIKSQQYQIAAKSHALDLQQFLPHIPLGSTTLQLDLKGLGWNPTEATTEADLGLKIEQLTYQGKSLDSLSLKASLHQEQLIAQLIAQHPYLSTHMDFTGQLNDSMLSGQLTLQDTYVDLCSLGLTDSTLSVAANLSADLYSNLKDEHHMTGSLGEIKVVIPQDTIRADQIVLHIDTQSDQLVASIGSEDLSIALNSHAPFDALPNAVNDIQHWIASYKQDNLRVNSYRDLLRILPDVELQINVGQQNVLSRFLHRRGLNYHSLRASLSSDHTSGINGIIRVSKLQYDTIRTDDAEVRIATKYPTHPIILQRLVSIAEQLPSDEMRPMLLADLQRQFDTDSLPTYPYLQIDAQAYSEARPNTLPYDISTHIETDLVGVDLKLDWVRSSKPYYSLDVNGYYNAKGFGLALDESALVIAGERLTANPNNILFYFRKGNQIYANIDLRNSQGAQLSIHSDQEGNQDNYRNLNLNIQRLELADLSRMFHLPSLTGRTFMDVHIEQEEGLYRATGDLSINDMTYEHSPIGNISIAFFYEPRDNDSHYLTAQISNNGNQTLMLDGIYHTRDHENPIDLKASFSDFPLTLINPFLPMEFVSLGGFVQGALSVGGSPKNIRLNGAPYIEQGKMNLPKTGNTFLLDPTPIKIQNSHVWLEQYKITLEGKSKPLTIDGDLYLFGPQAMQCDLHLFADHTPIIDSPIRSRQEIRGHAILSTDVRMRGLLTAPLVRGSATLHGGTNVTYTLSSGSVQERDQMRDVIEFVNLKDSTDIFSFVRSNVPISSHNRLKLTLDLTIDPAVQLGVELSPRGEDYVQILGGGSLRMSYSQQGSLSLVGRYEFTGGEVRYGFPIVGRRLFEIAPSSFLSWSGDPMNPFLHLVASQRLRTDVSEGELQKKVDFDVSIKADQNVQNLSVAFDVEAPEDLNTQAKLSSMSNEERAKQAVALLLSGTFLSDLGDISMEKILGNVAMNELNNLTGKLLQGTDLSIGMEGNAFNRALPTQTDYTYSFSRRFLNDRIRFVIGGRIASGNLPTNYEQTFIDNVTFEYRLDDAGRQYVTLFHRRNNDNILEGVVTETGIGYLIKAKLKNFKDLFDWHRYLWWIRKKELPRVPKQKQSEIPLLPSPIDSLSSSPLPRPSHPDTTTQATHLYGR